MVNLIFSLLFCTTSSLGYKITEDHPKIVGGEDANIADYPYQISLCYKGKHFCGGTIVGPRKIVTAAHCTVGFRDSSLTVRVGSSIVDHNGEVIKVKKAVEHPNYNEDSFDYDVSVIVLSSTISHKYAKQIKMAEINDTIQYGSTGVVTGWGTTEFNVTLQPAQLQMVKVPIISQTECFQYFGPYVTENMLCAGSNRKDSCQGDSGGPLVVNNSLVGIVSWGYKCGIFPGVYTKVSKMRTFIDSIDNGVYQSYSLILVLTCLNVLFFYR